MDDWGRTSAPDSSSARMARAAGEGDQARVVALLAGDPTLANACYEGHSNRPTALHLAASNGHLEVVALLLHHGAVVNARDASGMTPLHIAAGIGHLGVAALLLDHGADPLAETSTGWTPHMVAEKGGHDDVFGLLGVAIATTNQRHALPPGFSWHEFLDFPAIREKRGRGLPVTRDDVLEAVKQLAASQGSQARSRPAAAPTPAESEWQYCEIESDYHEDARTDYIAVTYNAKGKVVPHDHAGPIHGKVNHGVFERGSKREDKRQRLLNELVQRLVSSGWQPMTSHPVTRLPRFRRQADHPLAGKWTLY